MKILIASLILIMATPADWMSDMEAAKALAQKEGKSILLNFSGSDWCAPCIKMKKEVFENEAFQALAEKHLVLVRADFPRSKKNQLSKEQTKNNEALAEKYNPKGKFPLTLLLDSSGNVIREWDGYVFASQDKFISDLDKTVSTK